MSDHIAGKETASDHAKIIQEHAHGYQYVYPTLADGVTLTSDAEVSHVLADREYGLLI